MKPLLTLLAFFISINSSGQSKNDWATYMADYDGYPGSTLLDMTLYKKGIDKRLTVSCKISLTTKEPLTGELSNTDEIDRMTIFLEKVIARASKSIRITTAGYFALKDKRSAYTYIADSVTALKAIRNAFHKLYPTEQFELIFRVDTNWAAYYKFLYPNEEALKTMKEIQTR